MSKWNQVMKKLRQVLHLLRVNIKTIVGFEILYKILSLTIWNSKECAPSRKEHTLLIFGLYFFTLTDFAFDHWE